MEGTVGGKIYFVGNKRLMEKKNLITPEVEEVINLFAQGSKTPVFMATEQKILGILGLSDEIKKPRAMRDGGIELHVRVATDESIFGVGKE